MKTTYRFQGKQGFSTDPLTGIVSKGHQTYSLRIGQGPSPGRWPASAYIFGFAGRLQPAGQDALEDAAERIVRGAVDIFEQAVLRRMRFEDRAGRSPCQFSYYRYDRISTSLIAVGGIKCRWTAWFAKGLIERRLDRILRESFQSAWPMTACIQPCVCDGWTCTVARGSRWIPQFGLPPWGACTFTFSATIYYTDKSFVGTCVVGGGGFPSGLPAHNYPDPTAFPRGPLFLA